MSPTIKNAEDLEIFKRSRLMVKRIYEITDSGKLSHERSLKNQMRRAAVSVLSNIAEGFERGSNKEFAKFLYISKGSLFELKTQILICYDLNYIKDSLYSELSNECMETGKMIGKLINYLAKTNYKYRTK